MTGGECMGDFFICLCLAISFGREDAQGEFH